MALLIVPGQAANFFPVFNSSDYKAPFEVNVTHLQRYTCLSASKVSQRIKVLAPDSPRVTWTGQATPLAIQIMRVSKARKRYDTYSFLSFQMLFFFSVFFFSGNLYVKYHFRVITIITNLTFLTSFFQKILLLIYGHTPSFFGIPTLPSLSCLNRLCVCVPGAGEAQEHDGRLGALRLREVAAHLHEAVLHTRGRLEAR